MSAPNENPEQPPEAARPAAPKNPQANYLQEAVRLVELLIENQNKTFDGIDRKAVWLVTLCIATMGYLLSFKPENWLYLPSMVFLILAMAIWKGAAVLFLRGFWSPGAAPEYTLYKPFGRDINKMAEDLLGYYQTIFHKNRDTLKEKTSELRKALILAKIGIVGAFLIIFFHHFAPAILPLCEKQ